VVESGFVAGAEFGSVCGFGSGGVLEGMALSVFDADGTSGAGLLAAVG
jgi:hypothetical protein